MDPAPPSTVRSDRKGRFCRSRVVERRRTGWCSRSGGAKAPGLFRACFTTRVGGSSEGQFASLNLDSRSDDSREAVALNRSRIEGGVGRKFMSPLQVHGVRVAGASEYAAEESGSPCDGLLRSIRRYR